MPAQPAITLRPFHEMDTAFLTGLATDERVTRFVNDGRPWTPQAVQDRLRAALRQEPVEQIGAVRWFIAVEAEEAVGLDRYVLARTRQHGPTIEERPVHGGASHR